MNSPPIKVMKGDRFGNFGVLKLYRNCDTIIKRSIIMAKTVTVHTRVTSSIKEEAEKIFSKIGLTTSQAIMLFLTASVNNNGLPFELKISKKKEDEDLKFAKAIASIDGAMPSKEAEKILNLYSKGIIDYETAEFAIERLHKK